MSTRKLEAFIDKIHYDPIFDSQKKYPSYELGSFNINLAGSSGLINTSPYRYVTYAKWSSPKRTRSYPFARLYDAFKKDSTKIAIIPIIKDEGKDSLNNDRINAMTLSWMNLLGIHIILAYYISAEKKPGRKNLLRSQKFDEIYIRNKIVELIESKKDAYSWNNAHFSNDFKEIYEKAVTCYLDISKNKKVKLHSSRDHNKKLKQYILKDVFNLDLFYERSNIASRGAQKREAKSNYALKYVPQKKGLINIKNHKGGLYFLTVENLIISNRKAVIQEEVKTNSRILPSKQSVKDALFKLILFGNIAKLYVGGNKIDYRIKLIIKGNFKDHLLLPTTLTEIKSFVITNGLTDSEEQYLCDLNKESTKNSMSIELLSNYVIHKNVDIQYFQYDKDKLRIVSPLRYPGGKSKALKTIIPNIPSYLEYREPFVGGGSVFLSLIQLAANKKILINDLNYDLYCFWDILKKQGLELVDEAKKIRDKFTDGRKLYKQMLPKKEYSPFERAVRFFVLNRITFSGTIDSGGYSEESFQKRFTNSSIKRLESSIPLMQNVEVYHGDYKALVNSPGKDVFIFLDPPYLTASESRLYGNNGSLHSSFDHIEFSKIMKGCEHKWLITYDDSPYIRELFDFAYQYEWSLQYGMNNYKQSNAEIGNELFITNYPLKEQKK